jgi:hypothetical protein
MMNTSGSSKGGAVLIYKGLLAALTACECEEAVLYERYPLVRQQQRKLLSSCLGKDKKENLPIIGNTLQTKLSPRFKKQVPRREDQTQDDHTQ